MVYRKMLSYSGDWFAVPRDSYDADVKVYSKALNDRDEATLLYYESGKTGWIQLKSYTDKVTIK